MIWTFFRVGKDGSPDGEYGPDYENAAREGIERAGGGRWRAEFVHDSDLPEWLRYRGWWSKLWAYNPDALLANGDSSVYVADLDTVFLRELDRLAAAFDSDPHDITGMRLFNQWQSGLLRVRRGSPGARRVWEAFVTQHNHKQGDPEHMFVQKHAEVGAIDDGLVVSYKGMRSGKCPGDIDAACALAFHGHPRPHEVGRGDFMGQLVTDNWRPL